MELVTIMIMKSWTKSLDKQVMFTEISYLNKKKIEDTPLFVHSVYQWKEKWWWACYFGKHQDPGNRLKRWLHNFSGIS